MIRIDTTSKLEIQRLRGQVVSMQNEIDKLSTLVSVAKYAMFTVASILLLAIAFLAEQLFLPFLKTL